ncbi:MAG: glycosyltransferase [Candidatus Azobacteroides sp.]|nr:glycosyltransferase [Candidatus Azobacteroides sp.]
MIVVIPCYKEPELYRTIQSLFDCERGNFPVEIILLINSYRIDTDEVLTINRDSYRQMTDFASKNNSSDFFLTPILIENLSGHQTGAGLPRKLGMDEAVRHLNGDKTGIIVSLDADCLVAANYLTEIYRNFNEYRLNSATIEFHHPVEHLDASDPLRIATINYENYLRYYRLALEFCGYPYPYFTIGSAFAVTAETYLKVGGMGKQQSGEDFYFLQKVFPLGKTRFINTTCVYPAARTSDRVPFGTGPALQKMVTENQLSKLTYQVEAFKTLKVFFGTIDLFFKKPTHEIEAYIENLPEYLRLFLKEDDFLHKTEEINRHTASLSNFRKRFFHYFNAFKILKYLNFVHPVYFDWADVQEQYTLLINAG